MSGVRCQSILKVSRDEVRAAKFPKAHSTVFVIRAGTKFAEVDYTKCLWQHWWILPCEQCKSYYDGRREHSCEALS